ncbi:N-acetylneuraminate synthase family protein [Acinetobacter faecalis]|uniref:N-acetylneuraminate synthase family protein n=1 Tax=Acinetobacter faecalis TaxID=2665161 RepID=UPI002A9205E3|nr:N-acetylneuraminate synthase family protein [Acinetobacter faecalis]MDY6531278.1 N-acetylneuraminate synthase family protein [Acinetobacter faecalis]
MIFSENEIYVIAEIGVNHNGSIELAKELILKAKDCGANAVKFQTFKAESLLSDQTEMAAYQKENTGSSQSQLELVKSLELTNEQTREIQHFCDVENITFISTPFDSESLRFLVNDLDVPFLKVSSADISNLPFLYEFACTGKHVILSTGTASLGDIEQALSVFAFVLDKGTEVRPSQQLFRESYSKFDIRKKLKERVSILHCVTQYPALFEQTNLRAIETIKNVFGLTTGYSDHTLDEYAAVIGLSLGARIFEKHITLDKTMDGPDHAASMEPAEFKQYIEILNKTHAALGDGIKFMLEQESENYHLVRRSIVASKDIAKGELLTSDNITMKRAGRVCLEPNKYWDVIETHAKRAFKKNDFIEL